MIQNNHFFSSTLCKFNIEYFMGWIFLILGYCFVISCVLANPVKLNYGKNKTLIEVIFILGGCFLITIFSRCICYKKGRETYLLDNNEIDYNSYNRGDER